MFRKVNAFGRMIDCRCCVHDDVSKAGATVGLSTDVSIVLRKDRTVLPSTLYYYSNKLPSIPEVLYSREFYKSSDWHIKSAFLLRKCGFLCFKSADSPILFL